MSISQPKTIFGPGLNGPSENYRIPSMVVTKNGTLVACVDSRYFTGGDNPNRIEKVVRLSNDSGETWSDFITVVEEHGESKAKSSSSIDPVMVYVEKINRIYMFYSHTPAGIGILNCSCCTGEDKDGNKILKDGFKKYIIKDNKLFKKNGNATPYTVNDNGDILENGKVISNMYTEKKFAELGTAYLMMCYSDDDGKTWSKQYSLNGMVKKSYMSFIGSGPGCGIVVEKGKYKGRIIVPMYYGTAKWPLMLSCASLYSDDMGETWTFGKSPNETRRIHGRKGTTRLLIDNEMLTESQLIELPDGTLKLFMRNHDKKRRVAYAFSKNGGESWEDFQWDDNLPQSICQMSVITMKNLDKPYVFFLNPASERTRTNGVLRLSEDGGHTFPYSRLLKEGPFVYSSLAQLPDGNIGALYEPDLEGKRLDFCKFSLDWVKGDN